MIAALPQAPRTPWSRFLQSFDWLPGEHVAIVGPAGSGKTVLLQELTGIRTYGAVFATKPRDNSMEEIIARQGYEKFDKWPKGLDPNKHPRRVIWPPATSIDAARTQAPIFADAFSEIYGEGAWNLYLDEGWYITNMLGLGMQIKVMLLQARSLDISLILATQRPVSVPPEVWDQSTHIFLFRENDERNLERMGGIAWKDSLAVRNMISNLDQYQFLYYNTRTGYMVRSRVPYRPPYVPPKKSWWQK